MTGSKTNSSSCKLNITGKAAWGCPGASGEEAFSPRLLPPPAGTEGAPVPGAAGQPGLRLLFPLFERGALTLGCPQPPGSRLRPRGPCGLRVRVTGYLTPGSVVREPVSGSLPPKPRSPAAAISLLARSREVSSCFTPPPPRGCGVMGFPKCCQESGKVALRGPRVGAPGGCAGPRPEPTSPALAASKWSTTSWRTRRRRCSAIM